MVRLERSSIDTRVHPRPTQYAKITERTQKDTGGDILSTNLSTGAAMGGAEAIFEIFALLGLFLGLNNITTITTVVLVEQ